MPGPRCQHLSFFLTQNKSKRKLFLPLKDEFRTKYRSRLLNAHLQQIASSPQTQAVASGSQKGCDNLMKPLCEKETSASSWHDDQTTQSDHSQQSSSPTVTKMTSNLPPSHSPSSERTQLMK